MTTPEWRPVPGYETSHEVSSWGCVRTLDRVDSNGRRRRGQVLRAPISGSYRQVHMRHNGTAKPARVHRLVCLAFHGPANGLQVRHLDGDSLNNCADNLAWGTGSENELDSVAHGTHHVARRTECPAYHPYDDANTYRPPGRSRERKCKTCMRQRSRQPRR